MKKIFLIIIFTIFSNLSFSHEYLESFAITSNHMSPTLDKGKQVLAYVDWYKEMLPQYGDIVIYTDNNDVPQIMRVVGLPLDVIQMKDGVLHINSVEVKKNKINDIDISLSEGSKKINVEVYEETLPNGVIHQTYDIGLTKPDNVKAFKVPEYSYFLLGDNRDNSKDSRFVGPVKQKQISDRVLMSIEEIFVN